MRYRLRAQRSGEESGEGAFALSGRGKARVKKKEEEWEVKGNKGGEKVRALLQTSSSLAGTVQC